MTTFIDLHVLQTVPSSNINRDDTGSPKTATFGGVRRARVSSQAWKRAIRKDFAAFMADGDRGVRTRRVVADVVRRLESSGVDAEEARGLAVAVFGAAGIKVESPKRKKAMTDADGVAPDEAEMSQYLLFLSNQQLDRLAALALESRGQGIDKSLARAAIKDGNGIEVALFGRMVADDTAYNVDAAVQVAHAISTHGVETEYDYFTAVDDAKPDSEDAGAGMIGVVEFNSSTLYRYATINLDQLMVNVGDAEAVARAVESFVRSFVVSMPTGKQNTFANGTLPDAVMAQIRTRRPINLVGAFEEPAVRTPGEALSVRSATLLAQRADDVDATFGTTPTAAYYLAAGSQVAQALVGSGEQVGLDALVDAMGRHARDSVCADA